MKAALGQEGSKQREGRGRKRETQAGKEGEKNDKKKLKG